MTTPITHRDSLSSKHNIWIYCILIASSLLSALFMVHNIKISPDSMRFGLISEEILSGNGIRVPIIRLLDTFVPVNGAIPFLDNMPLLPILFALLGGVTQQNFLPAQIVNLICHVAISLFAFLIMRLLFDNKGVALLTGIIISVSYPMLWLTHHMISDPLLIALTIAAVFFLMQSRNPNCLRSNRYIIAAGIFGGAAILARNAGIALIPVFAWEAVVLIRNKRLKFRNISAILALALPLIFSTGMFIRNYIISGSLRGFNQSSPERSYLDAFIGTVGMIFEQFQLGRNSIILITLLLTVSVLYILFKGRLRERIMKSASAGLDVIIVYMLSYTALICLTMAKVQWRYELRYVAPLAPFLIIVTVFIVFILWERTGSQRLSGLSLAGMVLSLFILTFGIFYKTYMNSAEFTYKQNKQYAIQQTCTFTWLKEQYGEDIIITTNESFHLSFFGGYSTVWIPHKMFNPTNYIPEDMETVLPRQMRKIGSPVLALFDAVKEEYDGKYLAELFNNRESNSSFDKIYECADGVVYGLKVPITH